MYLYPFKIFTISKNKRLLDPSNIQRTIGIYDAKKFNYEDAKQVAEINDAKVSILLGDLTSDVRLMVLDLDDCFDENGNIEKDTTEFLEEFDKSEWEISSSGTGIHIYILTKIKMETFIVKDLEGCKSFECYTNKRHIVTTNFDFMNTNLQIGKHDEFIKDLYDLMESVRQERNPQKNDMVEFVKDVFNGEIVKEETEVYGKIYERTPVTDMHTLRGCGYKDANLIEIIDADPKSVDQSAHDAKLIRKLMYYTLSFNSAHDMAKKTNYYKAKDDFHKRKFDDPKYIERTRKFIGGGMI